MKYYLAGPMSGIKQLNFPAFYAAAESLRSRGMEIISPAEMDSPEVVKAALASDGEYTGNGTWGDFLSRDVKIVADDVEGIVFMRGWHKSKGARLEAYVGLTCGHEFKFFDEINGAVRTLSRKNVARVVSDGITY